MINNRTINSPHLRRLHADLIAMLELTRASDLIAVSYTGTPPDRYHVTYTCRGLYRAEGRVQPALLERHEADFYLHRDYPRRPPQITWRTAIFHPNILSGARGGGVCIGSWAPSESLADLVLRVGEMIQYKSYNAGDVLDPEAAAWVQLHTAVLPVDDRPLAVFCV